MTYLLMMKRCIGYVVQSIPVEDCNGESSAAFLLPAEESAVP